MPEYQVHRSSTLTPDEQREWSARLAERDFGEVAIGWTEALRASSPPNVELEYFQVFAGEVPVALTIVHVVRKVDLAGYVGGAVRRIFAVIGKLGWRPLSTDIAFVEIPLANLSGILFAPGAEQHAGAIAQAVLNAVRSSVRYDILCLKASPSAPGEAAFANLGLMHTEFLANMSASLAGAASFDEYLLRIPQKLRTQSRAYRKEFAKVDGSIELVEDFSALDLDEIARLYGSTAALHDAQGDLAVPIAIGRSYFQALTELPRHCRRAFFARVGGVVVGFAFLVDSGRVTMFTHCGLDHARAVPSRAYFNLYYAMFAHAIANGYSALELGANAYVVKRKMGGVAAPTCYYFEVTQPLLAAVARFVAKHFASQEGASQALREGARTRNLGGTGNS